jgi:phospholipid/cholesterol/gamma-HCH transport system substrate-binding protein
MSEKANQFRIGLFVTVGVAIVLGGLFLFGIRSAFQPTYEFETYVTTNVDGLSVGSVVLLRGVAIGKVTQIGFSWNVYKVEQPACVVVRCRVRQKITPEQWRSDFETSVEKYIARGLRAVVQTQGITGSSVIALQTMDPKLYPPLKVPWTPKYWYVPSAPSQLGRLLDSVDRTLSNLEKFDAGGLSKSLSRTLDTADAALEKLNELDVRGISKNANQVLVNAAGAIAEVRGLVEDARNEVRQMKLGAVGEDADRLVDKVDAKLGALLDRLNAIDVRSLNETLAGTREAARSLNEVLEELKRYPSGFLLGGAPAPARDIEKEKK